MSPFAPQKQRHFRGAKGDTCFRADPKWRFSRLKINPPGGRYGLCLHEVRLLGPKGKAREVKSRAGNSCPLRLGN